MVKGDSGEKNTTRRSFVDWVLGTSAAGLLLSVLYPAARYIVPPEVAESGEATVTLPFAASEVEPGSARAFRFGSKPGLLVRTGGGEFRAFSAVCTHLGCTVQHRADLGHIWCACHNGHFDLNGHVVSGPPPEPLESFSVNVREDQIVVSRGA